MRVAFPNRSVLIGRLLIALAACGPALSTGQAEDLEIQDEATEQAERWVEQLGASSYQLREEAAIRLSEMGAPALPPLREAARHGDLEIRYRAMSLLEAIERVEQQKALDEFLATGDPELSALLPGWQRFSEIAGADLSARQLFVDMYRAEPSIMRLTGRSGVGLQTIVEQRSLRFRAGDRRQFNARMSPATLAVFLFVMLDPGCELSVGTRSLSSVVIGQSQIAAALDESSDSALRRLMGKWVAEADQVSPPHRIAVGMQYSLESGVEPALQMIQLGVQGSHLQNAIHAIGRLGGPEHIAALSTLLNDTTQLAEQQQKSKSPFTSQVRDVALAVILHLSGQNPADYGFLKLRLHPKHLYQPNSAGFDSDETRDRAFTQWQLWTRVQRSQALAIDATAIAGVPL